LTRSRRAARARISSTRRRKSRTRSRPSPSCCKQAPPRMQQPPMLPWTPGCPRPHERSSSERQRRRPLPSAGPRASTPALSVGACVGALGQRSPEGANRGHRRRTLTSPWVAPTTSAASNRPGAVAALAASSTPWRHSFAFASTASLGRAVGAAATAADPTRTWRCAEKPCSAPRSGHPIGVADGVRVPRCPRRRRSIRCAPQQQRPRTYPGVLNKPPGVL